MSYALVDLARALVGWLRGGLGMSVIVVSYFFSDICGSKMAEVSALGSTLMPPLKRAGYRPADGASLIAAGTAMGMLIPPAIFLIVIGEVTNVSVVALFLAGFVPAAVIGVCLCLLVALQAYLLGWPKDTRPSWRFLLHALREAAVPLVIPLVILGGFYFGAFTATEAGALGTYLNQLFQRTFAVAKEVRTTTEIGALTTTQIGGLTTTGISSMSVAEVQALSTTEISAMTSTQGLAFTSTQIHGMSDPQISELFVITG